MPKVIPASERAVSLSDIIESPSVPFCIPESPTFTSRSATFTSAAALTIGLTVIA
ncbi:hypothetical protein [Companilactobacillus crustorum]|uniref:hypothetical protein n=1 Tax=Companilactobacillus crustorum TaxID=392416 RepID=UPI0012EC7E16|nr:hypothetical protein [Companilactobacillus crustorum]